MTATETAEPTTDDQQTGGTPWHRPRWKWALAAVVALLATPTGWKLLGTTLGAATGLVTVEAGGGPEAAGLVTAWVIILAIYSVLFVGMGTLVKRRLAD